MLLNPLLESEEYERLRSLFSHEAIYNAVLNEVLPRRGWYVVENDPGGNGKSAFLKIAKTLPAEQDAETGERIHPPRHASLHAFGETPWAALAQLFLRIDSDAYKKYIYWREEPDATRISRL